MIAREMQVPVEHQGLSPTPASKPLMEATEGMQEGACLSPKSMSTGRTRWHLPLGRPLPLLPISTSTVGEVNLVLTCVCSWPVHTLCWLGIIWG